MGQGRGHLADAGQAGGALQLRLLLALGGVGGFQLLGAGQYAGLQLAPGCFAQPPIQAAQQQHAQAQGGQGHRLVARLRDLGHVGHHRQGPSQRGQRLSSASRRRVWPSRRVRTTAWDSSAQGRAS